VRLAAALRWARRANQNRVTPDRVSAGRRQFDPQQITSLSGYRENKFDGMATLATVTE
jgi:hypothetical protein